MWRSYHVLTLYCFTQFVLLCGCSIFLHIGLFFTSGASILLSSGCNLKLRLKILDPGPAFFERLSFYSLPINFWSIAFCELIWKWLDPSLHLPILPSISRSSPPPTLFSILFLYTKQLYISFHIFALLFTMLHSRKWMSPVRPSQCSGVT